MASVKLITTSFMNKYLYLSRVVMWLGLWILEDNGTHANKVYYANFKFNTQIRISWWSIKLSKFREKRELISVFLVYLNIGL